jgi:hypothetical protein
MTKLAVLETDRTAQSTKIVDQIELRNASKESAGLNLEMVPSTEASFARSLPRGHVVDRYSYFSGQNQGKMLL